MTTVFDTWAFQATGEPTPRTLSARLADIKNVKDFGATGNGVTDDWAAITAAMNWTVVDTNRGLIYFPPGTYIVSQPIDFSDVPNGIANVIFRGEIGLSSVIGNFADYVFKRVSTDTAGDGGVHAAEGLTVVNNNATGGGIRIGYCVGAAVRDCVVTANLGINTASDDVIGGVTSQEVSIENCTLSPGAHTSGSLGIMSVSDGPIVNCSIVGFDKGIIGWGNQGCQNVIGCHIELCGIGVQSGFRPDGSAPGNAAMRISGCAFKNCGTAISGGGSMIIAGVRIDAATGTITGDPQYGINGSFGSCMFGGVIVAGQFQQYGIALAADGNARNRSTFSGVQVNNSAGLGNWNVQSPAGSQFIGCNFAPVATVATLPAFLVGINTLSWSAGTTKTNLLFNIGNFIESPMTVTVEGATPSGYNGTFPVGVTWPVTSASWSGTPGGSGTATITVTGLTVNGSVALTVSGITPAGFNGRFSTTANSGTNTVIYTVNDPGSPTGTGGNVTASVSGNDVFYSESNPGSPTGSAGNAVINYLNNALEGDCYNVSDSDVTTWGGNPVGGGSTHAKVRWNGSNWTVMGK